MSLSSLLHLPSKKNSTRSSSLQSAHQHTRARVGGILDEVETGALTRLNSRVDETDVYDIMRYEIGVIKDAQKNLSYLLDEFDPSDQELVGTLNRRANIWVEARLGNMNNMAEFLITKVPDKKKFQHLVITHGWKVLLTQIVKYQTANQLRLSMDNERKIEILATKLTPIIQKLGMN